jgi:hypothetical protein
MTKGSEVRGEKYGELSEDRVLRSEPQMPERRGFRRTQSRVGSSGSATSWSLSGERRLVSKPFIRFAPARMRR